MCGIFGFALKKHVPTATVFRTLERLEAHKYPEEPTPLGGYGAGIAVLLDDKSVFFEKVGKESDSPARQLSQMVEDKVKYASVMIGHVRLPSPEFMQTAKFKETAQPYVAQSDPTLTIASVHNGRVENYREIRQKLAPEHVFESEKVGLVDSEVIPHYFGEILNEIEDVDSALYALFCSLQGSGSMALLQAGEEDIFIHLMHKGKTRGLTVWTNKSGEMLFCTRKEPLTYEIQKMLTNGKFTEKATIHYREDAGLKLSFPIDFEIR